MLNNIKERELGLYDTSVRESRFWKEVSSQRSLLQRLELQRKLKSHDGCVNTCAFTPDGLSLISGSDDLQIAIWDWQEDRLRLKYHSGHAGNVFCAQKLAPPIEDTIVSSAADGHVRLSLLKEGGEVATCLLYEHDGRAHRIAVDPECSGTFYSSGEDGDVIKYDLRSGNCGAKLLVACMERGKRVPLPVNSISINPLRPWEICAAGGDAYARIYDLRMVRCQPTSVSRDTEEVEALYYVCPDHLRGGPTREHAHVHITAATFSSVGELLVTYNDECIYLFAPDLDQSALLNMYAESQLPREEGEDLKSEEHDDLDDLEDGSSGTGGEDQHNSHTNGDEETSERVTGDREESSNDIRVFLQRYEGHRNRRTVKRVSFLGASEEYVVSGSDCGHVFFWDKMSGRLLKYVKGDHMVVNCLATHRDFPLTLATSGIENDVKIWEPTAEAASAPGREFDEVMEKNKDKRTTTVLTPWGMAEILMHMTSERFRESGDEDDDMDPTDATITPDCRVV